VAASFLEDAIIALAPLVLHPVPLGQLAMNLAGEVLVPEVYSGHLGVGPAPKERRERQVEDASQALRWGLQVPPDQLGLRRMCDSFQLRKEVM